MMHWAGRICFAAALLMNAVTGAAAADSAAGARAGSAAADLPVRVWGTAPATVKRPAAAAQFSPATAGSLGGPCNGRLGADYIVMGGGTATWLSCDVKGALKLDGKIYQVFGYQTYGYGDVVLTVMEPGFAPQAENVDHVLYVDLRGVEATANPDRLADNRHFIIALTKDPITPNDDIAAQQDLSGHCAYTSFDKAIESCDGPNWSLHISAADMPVKQTGDCNIRLEADYITSGDDIWLDCNANGELKINGKIYDVFEYKTSGSGKVELNVIGQDHDAENDANDLSVQFQYVRNVKLAGTGGNMPADGLWNSRNFHITMETGTDENGDELSPMKRSLNGECVYPFTAKGARRQAGTMLESCKGPGWSLEVNADPPN